MDPLTLRSARVGLIGDRAHYEHVVRNVMQAQHSVWIATANLKDLWVEAGPGARRYQSIMASFDALAARGVELRILHAKIPSQAFRDAFDRQPRLIAGGLALRMCPRVHMKVVIVDAALLYVGSANWTGAGLGARGQDKRNFELGFVTTDERMIDDVQARYDALWRGSGCRSCKLKDVCEAPLDLPELGGERAVEVVQVRLPRKRQRVAVAKARGASRRRRRSRTA